MGEAVLSEDPLLSRRGCESKHRCKPHSTWPSRVSCFLVFSIPMHFSLTHILPSFSSAALQKGTFGTHLVATFHLQPSSPSSISLLPLNSTHFLQAVSQAKPLSLLPVPRGRLPSPFPCHRKQAQRTERYVHFNNLSLWARHLSFSSASLAASYLRSYLGRPRTSFDPQPFSFTINKPRPTFNSLRDKERNWTPTGYPLRVLSARSSKIQTSRPWMQSHGVVRLPSGKGIRIKARLRL